MNIGKNGRCRDQRDFGGRRGSLWIPGVLRRYLVKLRIIYLCVKYQYSVLQNLSSPH
jgi:hypothetical protein